MQPVTLLQPTTDDVILSQQQDNTAERAALSHEDADTLPVEMPTLVALTRRHFFLNRLKMFTFFFYKMTTLRINI